MVKVLGHRSCAGIGPENTVRAFKINAWVVNEIEDIERMKELGVDIISSDYPDRV